MCPGRVIVPTPRSVAAPLPPKAQQPSDSAEEIRDNNNKIMGNVIFGGSFFYFSSLTDPSFSGVPSGSSSIGVCVIGEVVLVVVLVSTSIGAFLRGGCLVGLPGPRLGVSTSM